MFLFRNCCSSSSSLLSPCNNESSKRRGTYTAFHHDHENGFSISSCTSLAEDEENPFLFSPLGKLPMPTSSSGYYMHFIHPNEWSPVFSSPGDFTLKLVHAVENTSRRHTLKYTFALTCGWLMEKNGEISRGNADTRLTSYVIYTRKSQEEIHEFLRTLALLLPGHALLAQMPTSASLFRKSMKARGIDMISFLCDLLQISKVGHNALVDLEAELCTLSIVRSFLGLPKLGDEQRMQVSNAASCDARIEHQRAPLPDSWIGKKSSKNTTYRSKKSSSLSSSFVGTFPKNTWGVRDYLPTQSQTMTLPTCLLSPPIISNRMSILDTPEHIKSNKFDHSPSTASLTSYDAGTSATCTTYVSPTDWKKKEFEAGSFTVEISCISLEHRHALYKITILHMDDYHHVKTFHVTKRYTDFYHLAQTVNAVEVNVSSHLPPKTIFRYQDALFLEKRSAALQTFLEFLLQLCYKNVLGQSIDMTDEPNVRAFLELPQMERTLIPGRRSGDSLTEDHMSMKNTSYTNKGKTSTLGPESPGTPEMYISSRTLFPRSDSF